MKKYMLLRELILTHLETPKTNSQLAKLIFNEVTSLSQSKISMAMRKLIDNNLVTRSEITFSKK